MSWFGETFNGSINSLKGQITKITKEVLADNEASSEESEPTTAIRELQALCESKDLEIAQLREELAKFEIDHPHPEIAKLQQENDHLNTCLDELQSEHQENLNQVISIRDKYKNELESMQIENKSIKSKLEELQNEKLKIIEEKDKEIAVLINKLNQDSNSEQTTNLKIEELINEIKLIKKSRHQLQDENDDLKNKLNLLELQKKTENDLKTEIERLSKRLQEKENENKLIEDIQKNSNLEIEKLTNLIETHKKIREELQEENKELKEKLSSVEQKEETENNLKIQIEELTKKLQEKENIEKLTENSQEFATIKIEQLSNEIEAVSKIKQQLQDEKKELREKLNSVEQQKETENNLRIQIEQLSKQLEAKEDDQKFIDDNNDLKSKFELMEKHAKELDIKLRVLENERDELSKKCKDFTGIEAKLFEIGNIQTAVEFKVKELVQALNIKANNNSIISLLEALEQEWSVNQESSQKLKDLIGSLESELISVKDENANLQAEMKNCSRKWAETEKNYNKEIGGLKAMISELKTQRQNDLNVSQADDVKRLEQEVAQCMNLLLTKNNEIKEYSRSVIELEQELQNLKGILQTKEKEMSFNAEQIHKLQEEIQKVTDEKSKLEEKTNLLENKNNELEKQSSELEIIKGNLEKQLLEVAAVQMEVEKIQSSKAELESYCNQLNQANIQLRNEIENLKAQVIVRETNLAELMKSNTYFQDEINRLQSQSNELINNEKEIKKWKEASVDLEIQRQDLLEKKNELEEECMRLRNELQQRDGGSAQLIEAELQETCQKQAEMIVELQEENTELKSRIQKFQEQIVQMVQTKNPEVQQHRRSKSDIEPTSAEATTEDVASLKQLIQQEQMKYRQLQNQYQEIAEKEANAKKEFERLKQHLIEVEDHYTEEAIENEKIINELKTKVTTAEEQLQNSSTLYTSMKVRDNQHLESLQSQIRMITTQRDDFQAKMSAAEDEVQKHKASLMSLQIVLEQFQQDKEREVEEVAMKYEKQLQATQERFKDFETEMEAYKKELAEAKNGLKAASRLGEQLEKKNQQVVELENTLRSLNEKASQLESSLCAANQSSNTKIDKSLIKNLVVGYVLSPNADRKSQALKILASVLEFDNDERSKMGVDATNSGWLSNILHPKGGTPSNQSLSEAFIKFLENESRPQPQVKFLPEQFEPKSSSAPKSTSASPKPSGRLSELLLPTFTSSEDNESSLILKGVLKDS